VAAAEDMTAYVPADELAANPDNLHFSAAGLYHFGRRYYDEFVKLERKDKVFEEKAAMDDAVRSPMEAL